MNDLIRDNRAQSKFDNTLGDLITLRRLFDAANACRQLDNLYQWQLVLQNIEVELYPLLQEDEQAHVDGVRVENAPPRIPKQYNVVGMRRRLNEYQKVLNMYRHKKGLSIASGDDIRQGARG